MKCQLHGLPKMTDTLSASNKLWQLRKRARRVIKRRFRYAINSLSEFIKGKGKAGSTGNETRLEAGDVVKVRSKAEIKATLDRWNRCRGCDIMEEMYAYCGTTQRVYKRVEKFVDEKEYRLRKCKGIIFLEDVFCEGTIDYGQCDRSCYFFWREEWLEKVIV